MLLSILAIGWHNEVELVAVQQDGLCRSQTRIDGEGRVTEVIQCKTITSQNAVTTPERSCLLNL